MNILIDTGTLDFPHRLENTPDSVDIEYNISEPRIYPSGGDTIISVGTNQMVVVTAYWAEAGDPAEQTIDTYKVLITSGVPESGSIGCCPTVTSEVSKILRKTKLCGWELKDCSPVMVITTPGKYQLIPNTAAEDVIITAQIFPLQEFNHGLDNSIRF